MVSAARRFVVVSGRSEESPRRVGEGVKVGMGRDIQSELEVENPTGCKHSRVFFW